jgi:DNA-binding transcriptional ArsR family regulator
LLHVVKAWSFALPDFPGFAKPYYTQVPDEIFDLFLTELSGAELKVLLYICRRTLGFKKESDNISLSQILTGIVTKEGKRLDSGTGLSKSTVLPVLRSLQDRGLIETERRRDEGHGNLPTTYSLRFRPDQSDPRTDFHTNPRTENPTKGGTETLPSPRTENPATQETVIQETERQDPSIRPATPALSSDDAALITSYVADFGDELHDTAPVKVSAARATRLYAEFGGGIREFCALMNDAKRRTQAHAPKRGTRMAYFFAVLESLVREGK